MGIVDRQVLETEHTNIIIGETRVDGGIMTVCVPVVGHYIIELGGIPFGLLGKENMRERRPFVVGVRACIGEIGKSVVKRERDDVAFRGGNGTKTTKGGRGVIHANLERFHLDQRQNRFMGRKDSTVTHNDDDKTMVGTNDGTTSAKRNCSEFMVINTG